MRTEGLARESSAEDVVWFPGHEYLLIIPLFVLVSS